MGQLGTEIKSTEVTPGTPGCPVPVADHHVSHVNGHKLGAYPPLCPRPSGVGLATNRFPHSIHCSISALNVAVHIGNFR